MLRSDIGDSTLCCVTATRPSPVHGFILTHGVRCLDWAYAAGTPCSAPIRNPSPSVITVQEPFDWIGVPETRASYRQALEDLAKHKQQVERDAASVLSRAADAAKRAGVPCDTMQVEDARPYQAIIAAASDRGCDLIVMSSHGRGGLSAIVLGSVTNKVLTHTKTPVAECAGPASSQGFFMSTRPS